MGVVVNVSSTCDTISSELDLAKILSTQIDTVGRHDGFRSNCTDSSRYLSLSSDVRADTIGRRLRSFMEEANPKLS